MSKATNAVIAALIAKFETGDIPDGPDFAQAIQLLQDAIQEHAHASGGGVGSGTGDATQVAYPGAMSGLFFDWPLSPMIVDGGVITNGTDANTIKVGELTALLRKTNTADGVLAKVTKNEEDNIAITNPDISYYVVLQYSGGTPAIILQAAKPNGTTNIGIGKCIRNGDGSRHVVNSGMRLANGLAKLHRRAATLRELELESGCAIAHTGTRNFTIGAGVVYGGINRFEPFDLGDFASLTDKFTLIYNDGSWQYVVDQTAIPNDKYNDYGVGLVDLGNNKYGCWWIFIHPGDEHVYAVYGTDTYTLSEALLENPPEHLPVLLTDFGTLIGCVVVKEGAALFAATQQVTAQYFGGAGAADHQGLANLQGGSVTERYHLTAAEHGGLAGLIVGVEWDQANDAWARIDGDGDPLLLNRSQFDGWLPWAGMRRVNLAVDGTINAVYGEADYKEDGTNGRVMVQIPKFWVKTESPSANKYRWWIADYAASGFEVHPAFNQRAVSKPADYIYVAAYEADGYLDVATFKLHSRAGVTPVTGGVSYPDLPNAGHFDIDEARTYAENIGSYWGMTNIWTLSAIQLLFMVEYGNMDSQTAVGSGIVDKSVGSGFAGENTASFSINGNLAGTDNGTGAGTGTNGLVPVSYRWIENPWGNVQGFVDGFMVDNNNYYILKATGLWTNSGPTVWGSGDYDLSVCAPLTDDDGYISNIEYESTLKYLLLPSASAGSSSTYIPDNLFSHVDGDDNLLQQGGTWYNGTNAGLACACMYNMLGDSARYHGCRLEFIG